MYLHFRRLEYRLIPSTVALASVACAATLDTDDHATDESESNTGYCVGCNRHRKVQEKAPKNSDRETELPVMPARKADDNA